MREGAARTESPDTLRGYEGKAGAVLLRRAEGAAAPRLGLSRASLPPAARSDQCRGLSLGYALLLKDAVAAVQLVGLDPYLGFFHTIEYARPSLALDLMEEFRPIMVDGMVLELVGRKQLRRPTSARPARRTWPVELSNGGVTLLLKAYEERLQQWYAIRCLATR